jgi:hypothetical protein
MKFRKKPVVIEAFQMTKERRKSNADWPMWLHTAWQRGVSEIGALYPQDYPNSNGKDMLRIATLEGNQLVSWNDYIIQGIQGEIYPCKPDIFEATYEAVV